MGGYVSTVQAFVLFEVMVLMTNLAMSAWILFLSCASPNLNVANPVSMVFILFFVLFAGFIITKDQISDYPVWIYWINPMAWSVRALAVNQYTDSSFDTCVYKGVDYCTNYNMTMGEYSLTTFEVPTERFWLWYGMVFMAAAYEFSTFLSCVALEYHRYESPENVTLDPVNKDSSSEEYGLMNTPRSSLNEAVVSVAPDREKHFIPVTIAFKDLWYTVPDPANPKDTIDVLKGISGYALPGTITALMGSSGAGKTTPMDVIAGRKTGGKISGQILLNGHSATDLAIRRSTGYCEQMDIHSESATIREALTFSAFLRQGADVPDSSKHDSVNECLDLQDLHPIADQIIRVEQMKRLTIGVEMAAQPSVLFLDEPTCGLDARSSKLIMDGVRKVANTGRTVLCTIHQPSTEVFSVFDSLLLLKRGGETVFVGELGKNANEMVAYFESIDGVAKLEDNYNPATWMLESSKHFQFLQSNLDREGVTRPSLDLPELTYSDKRAATEMTQTNFLLQRFFRMYWRTASYNLTRFSLFLILGPLFGVTYFSADYSSYACINSGMGMLFCTMGFIGFVSFTSVVPISSADRLAFYRERAAQTYNALWYFVGSTVVEIPYVFFSTMFFMMLFLRIHGSNHILRVLASSLHARAVTGVLWTIHVVPHADRRSCNSVWSADADDLLLVLDGDGSEVGCHVMTGLPPSLSENMKVKDYLGDVFLMKHGEIWENFGFFLGFIAVYRMLGLLALRFINHQKK
ncbi:hypothetical protein L917_01644 [Phytophthora nicotianae]|uniref:ABC transporter domain-containing protein n=1 Tax=Phytophthora nicotianae TaxID=4792 RepID=W2LYV6_PHYNI|nr:hypothetical protein L917_01644 [Phytophthora nicotianae]